MPPKKISQVHRTASLLLPPPLADSSTQRTSFLPVSAFPVRRNHSLQPPNFSFSITTTMKSISPVSPSMVLPPNNALRPWRPHVVLSSLTCTDRLPRLSSVIGFSYSPGRWRRAVVGCKCKLNGEVGDAEEDEEGKEEVERALHLDGTIPSSSGEFVRQISSRAYDMRRHLQQTFDSSSYDVLEANPWREESKPVYVLTHNENQLCTMKTRRNRSEVERELKLLFSKGGKRRSGIGSHATQSRPRSKFQMLVEDVREGVLVFEDENEAARYCDLLQGGGQGCEGVAEIEASSVFDLCHNIRALAVLFRRGRTPPLPQSLELNLRARKRSLEDQDDLI